MRVKTRFAPSPTGSLHVGSVRTALFSWLYAKHHNGEFILRIEDTDHERSTKESVDVILDGMQWLGLNADEEPIYQTNRYDRYNAVIQDLLTTGNAYRCYCSKERLETLREAQLAAREKPRYDGHCRFKNHQDNTLPSVIRFKNPQEGLVTFSDQIYGDITVNNQELDDFVIQRSDGNPTYNFAVVVDDLDMEITHVIRGDDHINNTPRQINLIKALNASLPIYAHLPMILGADGKRLSKRHGAVNVLEFKQSGILPAALLNYLVRLGWSHGDQELFTLEDMIKYFDLTHINRAAASFNNEKLLWLNQQHQKITPQDKLAEELQWHFTQKGIDTSQGPSLQDLMPLMIDRCKTLSEICDKSVYFYQEKLNYDEEAINKHWNVTSVSALNDLLPRLLALTEWNKDALHAAISATVTFLQLKMPQVAIPLRIAVTGSTVSPSIDDTLRLIGKERVLNRLKLALDIGVAV